MQSCAFTGYRPGRFVFKEKEDHPACLLLKSRIMDEIKKLYECGIRRFYTGCAQGVDLWAGEAVLQLRETHADVRLICVLPYAGHESRWKEEQQRRCRRLVEKCDETVTLSASADGKSYLMRNRFLVEQTDILLAVYSEESCPRRSGTGYTVNYARSLGRKIIFLNPEQAAVQRVICQKH